jgi:hypothetical protein
MNQSIKMCIASCFAISGGLVAMGILEQFDSPLTKKTCFTGYTDCGNELREHSYPKVPYMIGGLGAIILMYVILHNNKIFNKMEIDN